MWVVIRTKARSHVEIDGALETTFQDDNYYPVDPISNTDLVDTLCDVNGVFQKVQNVGTSTWNENESEEEDMYDQYSDGDDTNSNNEFETNSDEDEA